MSFVAVDLGASSSRHVSDSGQITVTPNYMAFLPDENPSRIQPDASDVASCLEVNIVKDSGSQCDYFPANVMIGIMADRFTNLHDRPSVNTRKCLQRINYVDAIVTAAINKLTQDISDDLSLYIAVPPIEITTAREMFAKQLIGGYTVTFPKYMGGTSVKFNVVDVQCYEESYMASTSFFFNMNGVPKEQNKKYLTGKVLSLDIGASTSDLAIIENGRYLDRSGRTYRIGGNEARDFLTNMISANFDIDLSIADAERTMAEGRLQQGNTYMDCSTYVIQAKQALAKKLINHMQTYFKSLEIDISSINAIVVSGGGSMQSQYINDDGEVVKTSEPMSYFVTNELISWSKGTEVVTYGDDARFANVKGLFIRAKMDELSKTASVPKQSVATAPAATVTSAQVQSAVTVQAPVQPVEPTVTPQVQTPVTPVAVEQPVTPVATTPVAPQVTI